MSFLQEIVKGVSLKKTQPTTSAHLQASDEQYKVKLYCNNDDDYNRLLSETSFDHYYQAIKQFTFQSVSLKITIEEANCLIEEYNEYCEKFKRNEEMKQVNSEDNIAEYSEWKNLDNFTTSSSSSVDEEKKNRRRILLNLSKRVDECVANLPNGQKDGFFCRMSTMSPKDAATNRLGFISLVWKHYNELLKMEKELDIDFQEEMNRNVYALYRASTSALKLTNGLDAVQLLIESERAQQELKKIASGVYGDETKTNELVLREWCNFDVAHEFRAFICNKKLTGITQYNPFVYFPHLSKQKDELEKLMKSFLEKDIINNPLITISNFIVDIIIVNEENSEKQVKIVELNPFAEFAGTCLFTWEHDRDILEGKSKNHQLEFRLVNECVVNCEKEMGNEWKDALKKLDKWKLKESSEI